MDEVDIGKLLEAYPIKTYATTGDLPTTNVSAGSLARVSADNGLYLYSGSSWSAITAGSHNHSAAEITSGTLAVARGGFGANFSTDSQGGFPYLSATGIFSVLAAGAVGQFLKTGGAGANPSWADPTTLTEHDIGSSTHSDITLTSVAEGDILYYDGAQWVNLAPGTRDQFLATQGASQNPVWQAATVGFVYDRVTANTQVNSSVTETTIYSKAIAAGDLSTNKRLRLQLQCSMQIKAGEDITLRLKYGATTLATAFIENNGVGDVTTMGAIVTALLSADGSATAQVGNIAFPAVAGFGATINEDLVATSGMGTATENSAGALNLIITAQHSANNAAQEINMQHALLELL